MADKLFCLHLLLAGSGAVAGGGEGGSGKGRAVSLLRTPGELSLVDSMSLNLAVGRRGCKCILKLHLDPCCCQTPGVVFTTTAGGGLTRNSEPVRHCHTQAGSSLLLMKQEFTLALATTSLKISKVTSLKIPKAESVFAAGGSSGKLVQNWALYCPVKAKPRD